MIGLVKIEDKFYELEFYSNSEDPEHRPKDLIVLNNKDKILTPNNIEQINGYLFGYGDIFITFYDCWMLMYMDDEIRYKFDSYVLTTNKLFDESDLTYIESLKTVNKFNL